MAHDSQETTVHTAGNLDNIIPIAIVSFGLVAGAIWSLRTSVQRN